jgi:hypothetical protein
MLTRTVALAALLAATLPAQSNFHWNNPLPPARPKGGA